MTITNQTAFCFIFLYRNVPPWCPVEGNLLLFYVPFVILAPKALIPCPAGLVTKWPLSDWPDKAAETESVWCGPHTCTFSNQLWGKNSLSGHWWTKGPWVTLQVCVRIQSGKCWNHPNSSECQATYYFRYLAPDMNCAFIFFFNLSTKLRLCYSI